MSDHDDPVYPGPTGAGRSGGGDGDSSGPPPTGFLRGVGVVVVAVIIGAVLMPSATRGPLNVAAASQTTPTSSTPPPTTPPHAAGTTTTQATIVSGAASIHVLVANATTITNLAGGTSTYLRTRGFNTLPALDATTKVTGTQVYAGAADRSAATTVANALGLSSNSIQPASAVPPVANATGANVVVIAGPDLARLAPGATASSTGTPTG
jgi:LytR cell envelope-related transcriptional attenuator